MPTFFDEQKWESLISSRPDWYVEIYPELSTLLQEAKEKTTEEARKIKDPIYSFFESKLEGGSVIIGSAGENWDAERETIDSIVIHHTGRAPGLSTSRINATHLVNLYIPRYANPKLLPQITGDPIWSGHFENDKQVFYAYHWLVRMDGSTERLLADNEIGWQAGNWDVNKKSIAICLDNDYSESEPSREVLEAVANVLKQHYPSLKRDNVIGHREVNPKTECPGNSFLGGWKEDLTAMI